MGCFTSKEQYNGTITVNLLQNICNTWLLLHVFKLLGSVPVQMVLHQLDYARLLSSGSCTLTNSVTQY